MANMIEEALQYMSETMLSTDVAGIVVRYEGKYGFSILVNALPVGQGKDRQYAAAVGTRPSESVFELLPPEKGYCGFLVRVDALKDSDGVPFLPDRGNRILIPNGSGSDIYELAAPKGMLPWRDEETLPHRVHYRIHTKFKGKEAA